MSQEREDRIKELADAIGIDIKALTRIVLPVGGQYLLDPNEINGWGQQGFSDDTNTQDLGDVGAGNISHLAGGFVFPFDVRITRFYAWHRNNNGAALPWGWVISRQIKTPSSNTASTAFMLDESFDRGVGQLNLRNYGNNRNQFTEITSFVNSTIPAGQTINLAVGAPTAGSTNRYVQILSGFIEFERLDI